MMAYVDVEKLLNQAEGSLYKLVILAARRAMELNEGAQKLVETRPDEKVSTIAIKEIEEGKITLKVREEKGKGKE